MLSHSNFDSFFSFRPCDLLKNENKMFWGRKINKRFFLQTNSHEHNKTRHTVQPAARLAEINH